jgi:hypothetical protein
MKLIGVKSGEPLVLEVDVGQALTDHTTLGPFATKLMKERRLTGTAHCPLNRYGRIRSPAR